MKKHIVIVTTSFPDFNYQPGGDLAGAFAFDFAEQLSNNASVTVLAPSGQDIVENIGGMVVRRFCVPSLPLSLLKPYNIFHWKKIIHTLKAGKDALNNLANEINIDHVFALWALPSGYWANNLKKNSGIPYSIWSLGSDIWVLRKIPVIRRVLRDVLRNADVRYADGYILKDDVFRIADKKCLFLPSSRKLPSAGTKIYKKTPPYNLAFLGRYHINKGIDIFLDSLDYLSGSDWGMISEVKIHGGGPMLRKVEEGISRLKNKGYAITLGGYLDRNAAAKLYQWADFIILPSRIESIPVIFSDCMQAGTPLISTPIGDLPRLINNFGVGILAEDTSSLSLSEAIKIGLNKSPVSFLEGMNKAKNEFSIDKSTSRFFERIFGKR